MRRVSWLRQAGRLRGIGVLLVMLLLLLLLLLLEM